MADDTPDTPTSEQGTPAPRRRAAPRKTGDRATSTRRPKSAVSPAEDAVTSAATSVKDAVVDAEQRAVRAVKPRSTKRATARPATSRTTRSTAAKASTTRATKASDTSTKSNRKPSTSRTRKADKSTLERATDRVGGKWAAAALAGVAAAGATAAAVLSLRGSSARNLGTEKKPIDISGSGDKGAGHPQTVKSGGGAHQPDGTDSSKSFQAGIADENSIPN